MNRYIGNLVFVKGSTGISVYMENQEPYTWLRDAGSVRLIGKVFVNVELSDDHIPEQIESLDRRIKEEIEDHPARIARMQADLARLHGLLSQKAEESNG